MARGAVAALLAWSMGGLAGAELLVESFGNCAMHGQPRSTSKVDTLSFSLAMDGCSAEVVGTLTLEQAGYYAFDCRFAGGQLAFVWLADHLICHTKPPFGNPRGSTDGSPENPLVVRAGQRLPVVVHVYGVSRSSGLSASRSAASLDVRWVRLSAPLPAGSEPVYEPIPSSALVGGLPPLEVKRRQLQKALLSGWNLWSYNLLDVVRLPESFALTTALCRLSSQDCLNETRIEDTTVLIRVGPFATDQSYWQFFLGYKGLNVSLSFTGGNGSLHVLAEPLNCRGAGALLSKAAANCSDYALVVVPRYVWFRGGEAMADAADGSLTLTPTGMRPTVLHAAPLAAALPLPPAVARAAATGLALGLGQGAVGLREGSEVPTVEELRAHVAAARAAEEQRYAKYGAFAEVKEAIQAATLWNYIYHPAEYGPFLPVSRSWNFVREPANTDWNYVIFDWDNIFASYMTSLDPASKDIAYSNFIQVIRSKTARGFVPNYSAGGTKTSDRTEPPIGAKVLLEMHRRYGDTWLVQLLFDDLLAWNDWFEHDRMISPAGLVSLGSNTISGASTGYMRMARLESGLDNSPMYDGEFFAKKVAAQGSYMVGEMQLYDVGFSSLVAQEAEALAELAPLAGRASEAGRLRARAERLRKLIGQHLWDEEGGIFTNRFWNGTFYRRISPTSFYPMLAGAATDEQARAMVQNWLLSPKHFCIAPKGDFAGNSDDCYWGLPSIDRSDPAFPALGYWRGYIWGPMAQLVYWSLQRYDHIPEVRSARKALCKQMTALLLSQWRQHRHICENFSPHKTADDHKGDCSGTKFYHWGALNGMISMVEEGFYSGSSFGERSSAEAFI